MNNNNNRLKIILFYILLFEIWKRTKWFIIYYNREMSTDFKLSDDELTRDPLMIFDLNDQLGKG